MNERPIPQAALRDSDSVEMLRVWIAERQIHCSIKIGMYRETMNIAEEVAWGTILADVARHISAALHSGYGADEMASLREIRVQFDKELKNPTSEADGDFVGR
jgi:hypothetical protein